MSTATTHPPPPDYILWYSSTGQSLPSSVGYLIIVGLGFLFCALTLVAFHFIQPPKSPSGDEFFTAGRMVGPGLTAGVIVSQWTWAATLLQSSAVAYKYGVSGPFWYASGATIQILLFAILAVYTKRHFPSARTFLEIILARYGPTVHKFFLGFALLTNLIVTAMLLLGGAAVCEDSAGVPRELGAFLIPLGVVIYTMFGGLFATFLAGYSNTVGIMIILCIFMFSVYCNPNGVIRGPSDMYYKLEYTQSRNIIDGKLWDNTGQVKVVFDKVYFLSHNAGKGYLTMQSLGAVMFGMINIVGNFGAVFVDQSYWQSIFAARPAASVPGFLMGGLVWFAIPFCLATTLGLSCAALEIPMTLEEVNEGLPASRAVVVVMGSGGAIAFLIMLFLAVTSTGSAELIAVGSIFTYDVYSHLCAKSLDKLPLPERATKLQRVSKWFIALFGVLMGFLAILLQATGISLGYMYMVMGVLIGSAVPPCFEAIIWSKTPAVAVLAGLLGGFVFGVGSWLVTAHRLYGAVTVETTGQDIPLLVGNLVSLLSSVVVSVFLTLVFPEQWDLAETDANIRMNHAILPKVAPSYQREAEEAPRQAQPSLASTKSRNTATSWKDLDDRIGADINPPDIISEADFHYYGRMARVCGVAMTLILLIFWPVPMYLSGYVFTIRFFQGWIILCFAWGTVATVVITIYPLIEIKEHVDDAKLREQKLGTDARVHPMAEIKQGRAEHDQRHGEQRSDTDPNVEAVELHTSARARARELSLPISPSLLTPLSSPSSI